MNSDGSQPDPLRLAYADGIAAGHRIEKYEGVSGEIPCPFPEDSPEAREWWEGFGNATQDLITLLDSD